MKSIHCGTLLYVEEAFAEGVHTLDVGEFLHLSLRAVLFLLAWLHPLLDNLLFHLG